MSKFLSNMRLVHLPSLFPKISNLFHSVKKPWSYDGLKWLVLNFQYHEYYWFCALFCLLIARRLHHTHTTPFTCLLWPNYIPFPCMHAMHQLGQKRKCPLCPFLLSLLDPKATSSAPFPLYFNSLKRHKTHLIAIKNAWCMPRSVLFWFCPNLELQLCPSVMILLPSVRARIKGLFLI